jgi:hypothetical protein
MKDLIEFRFTVATKELNGKMILPVAKVVGKSLKKVEPQIMRLVEVITAQLEKEIKED